MKKKIVIINQADVIRARAEKEIEALQGSCKHEHVSEWRDLCWAPGHFSGAQVKVCLVCSKIVEEAAKCWDCKKRLTKQELKLGFQYCVKCTANRTGSC